VPVQIDRRRVGAARHQREGHQRERGGHGRDRRGGRELGLVRQCEELRRVQSSVGAQASQITGTTFTSEKASSVEGQVFGCDYSGANAALLQVTVDTADGKGAFGLDVSSLKTVGYPPNSVTGVGDEAFSEPDPKGNAGAVGASSVASYGAVFGDVYIKVGGLTYVTASQGKQIVEELHGKL
jgi:hypothetical protein